MLTPKKEFFMLQPIYCKFGNRENFIFTNSVKRHICHIENSRLGHDLPASVKDSDFAISQGVYFLHNFPSRNFAKIKPLRKFPNLQQYTSIKYKSNTICSASQLAEGGLFIVGDAPALAC